MTIQRFTAGEPVDRLFSARTLNAFVESANFTQRLQQRGVPNIFGSYETRNSTVMVRNDTGGDLGVGAIVSLDSPLITPTTNLVEFQTRSGWAASAPVAADWGNFFVLVEPIPNGKIGLAAADGIVVCKVNISHSFLRRADISPGTTAYLDATPNGSAQILWIEAGTGQKWAAVRLGALRDAIVIGKPIADVTPGGTGEVNVWNNGTPTGYSIPGVKGDWMMSGQQITADKQTMVGWFAEERLWRFIGAECE